MATPESTLLPGVPRLLPGCATSDYGCDGLGSVFELFANASQIILALAGVVLLVTFIYGGILYLISGGRSEYLGKAKKAIWGSILGLVIIFVAYTAVTFVINAALGTPSGSFSGNYVFCTEDVPGDDSPTSLKAINDGEACGPSATCQNGLCVTDPDTVSNPTPSSP